MTVRELNLNLIRCYVPAPACERCQEPLPEKPSQDWLVSVEHTGVESVMYAVIVCPTCRVEVAAKGRPTFRREAAA